MNTIYISNAIIDSSKNINNLECYYGLKNTNTKKKLLVLCIIRELLIYGDWYEFSDTNKQMLQESYSEILRDNKEFIFDFPTNTIYSNMNTPQTSFTFDLSNI